MVSGTIRDVAGLELLDPACLPWVPIALVIALAAVAVLGAFVLRRDPPGGDDGTGDDLDLDPER